ncbi:MAG: von Willebrand factor type A domain-containing protein [Lachnospiraceae bacterium]|nr:von Willebrand factor type A domain-containing protein [Lachnospiraceae bacterium]
MKKRNFAVALLLGVILAACGNTESQYSQEEIDARVQEVGESYNTEAEIPNVPADAVHTSVLTASMDPQLKSTNASGVQFQVVGNNKVSVWVSGSDSRGYQPYYGSVIPNVNDVARNTEDYNSINEDGFVSVSTQPFSTFGADVDTAVYTNLRRSIMQNDGYGIRGNAIRVEEMINYFDYDYTKPAAGEKFGVVTDLAPCPWNADTLLLRVGVRAEEVSIEEGSNIVFLIDTSGSMDSPDKLPLVQEAFNKLQKNLTANDTVSIVTYAGSYSVPLEGVGGNEHQKIENALYSLMAGGCTNGEGGITKAYEVAEKYFIEGGNNRVILATDGDLNVGISSEAGLIDLIEEKKESGVFLSCLGFGEGNYQDAKMEAMADHGNGNYSYIDCDAEAERVLTKELWSTLYTVAKDVKFQVEFNPDQVKGYRLVGYENREMAAEDFADDTKDGGEVGSDQCVTVLYEVVLNDSAFEIPTVESRYADDEASTDISDELLAVNIRYKEPDSDVSQLRTYPVTKDMIGTTMDSDTSWAAGVAQFGMLLRDSDYAGTSSYDDIIARLEQDPKIMNDDLRAEFICLVEQVKDNGFDYYSQSAAPSIIIQ